MAKLKKLSGLEMIKALSKAGFVRIRQKGSHVIMKKQTEEGKIGCVVPLHKELKIGTIKGILEKVKLSEEEFMKFL